MTTRYYVTVWLCGVPFRTPQGELDGFSFEHAKAIVVRLRANGQPTAELVRVIEEVVDRSEGSLMGRRET